MAEQARPGGRGIGAEALLRPGMWDNLRLAWRLFRDPRVAPWLKGMVPILCVLYVVSPIDLIPDFILGLGQLDDLGVIGICVMIVLLLPRLAPRAIVHEHLAAMGNAAAGDPTMGRDETERVVEASYRVRSSSGNTQ